MCVHLWTSFIHEVQEHYFKLYAMIFLSFDLTVDLVYVLYDVKIEPLWVCMKLGWHVS